MPGQLKLIPKSMKYGVLLIGFEYTHSKKWETLPGISVDLYQVYRYTKSITKNILVFSDVDKDYRTSILKQAILDGYVDSGLLSFIEDIKEKSQYSKYESKKQNGYRMNNFDTVVTDYVKGLDKLIFYYTGHAKNGNIILPDNTQVSLDYVREILTQTNPTCQILSVLDCCESNGMSLPYRLSSLKVSSLSGSYRLNSLNFMKQKIICLSSSIITEDSMATRSGSVFTRELFGYLESHQDTVITVGQLKDIGTIYGSYPNLKMLWLWITKTKHSYLDITIDNCVITVTLENSHATMEKSESMKDYLRYHQHGRYDSIY